VASLQVVVYKTCTYFIKLDRLYIPLFTKIIVTALLKMLHHCHYGNFNSN
jgi:hypothetical protein